MTNELLKLAEKWDAGGAHPSGNDRYMQGFRDCMLVAAKGLRAAIASQGAEPVTDKQAETIARQYCGGLDTRWSFSDTGLRLMLQQCADWAAAFPKQVRAWNHEVCAECGEDYGHHTGMVCPTGDGNFTRAPKQASETAAGAVTDGQILAELVAVGPTEGSHGMWRQLTKEGFLKFARRILALRPPAPPAGISPAPLAGSETRMEKALQKAIEHPVEYETAAFRKGWRAALSQGDVSGEGEGSKEGKLTFSIPIDDCIVLHSSGPYPMYRCLDCGVFDYGPKRITHKEGCRVLAAKGAK